MSISELEGIREVPWETRNLGVPAFELDADTLPFWKGQNLAEQLHTSAGDRYFIQARVPANSPDQTAIIESLGFRTAELAIQPWLEFRKATLYQRYLEEPEIFYPRGVEPNKIAFECHQVTQLDSAIRKTIVDGSIGAFSKDRFHTDPHCKPDIADARIGLWLDHDLLKDPDSSCTLAYVDKTLFGYIVWRSGQFILGGVTPQFIGRGFAKALYLESMKHVNDESQELSTTISANNIEVLNLYARLEFSFRDPTYLFHLWGER